MVITVAMTTTTIIAVTAAVIKAAVIIAAAVIVVTHATAKEVVTRSGIAAARDPGEAERGEGHAAQTLALNRAERDLGRKDHGPESLARAKSHAGRARSLGGSPAGHHALSLGLTRVPSHARK
jgi:Spy/CpxP family protein refolding chaperone